MFERMNLMIDELVKTRRIKEVKANFIFLGHDIYEK